MSDKGIIALALAPVGVYVVAMGAIFAFSPTHFPGAVLAVGGSMVAIFSVAFANVVRLRRDRRRRVSST